MIGSLVKFGGIQRGIVDRDRRTYPHVANRAGVMPQQTQETGYLPGVQPFRAIQMPTKPESLR